ncbi:iron-sulfur cluster carrier protein ApbC [Pseudoalteromonas denitrificans]|uniref:Iron-sulfur cluster carrier protein n=1 Tax=Pseudoalteromonas denitrificans DSM 6059 TaxID=1123010 RepID=A0A1I1MJ22_9GAMM|nr:iron-sulfur cluster carrier protein ApbC [Pseudoalteromonas denitrificans]SFC85126.1 ATP-binding protein involved in chromosome partitioning [Pseudoalteromonas denitrificans DSM 6059]
MFSLNKLFNHSKTQKQHKKTSQECDFESLLQKSLEEYRSDVFPLGLLDCGLIVDLSFEKQLHAFACIKLTLELNFPAVGERIGIENYLIEKLALKVELTLTCKLKEAEKIHKIKHIILVASGKGGVGKSTTAVNLAASLKCEGAKVGILDADIYGPSIPILLGLEGEKPQAKDEKTMLPFEKEGIKSQSIGFLVPAESAMVWRGPMASGALTQLLNETDWGELDYLIVDMPPGTGDIQLTMSQKVPASGAIIVTTPQDLALADAQKGIAMFEKVKVPILGLIENMSHFICGHCDQTSHVFGQGGGKVMAHRYGIPLLAEIPLQLAIREYGEQGKMIADEPSLNISEFYRKAARLVASQLYYQQTSKSAVEIIITDD